LEVGIRNWGLGIGDWGLGNFILVAVLARFAWRRCGVATGSGQLLVLISMTSFPIWENIPLLIFLPLITFILKYFLAKDGDFGFDFLDDVAASFKGHLAVSGGNEDEEADFPSSDTAEAVVDMHAAQVILGECRLSDLVKGFVGHLGIGAVVDRDDLLALDLVGTHLPQKDIVGADIGLALVFSDAFTDEGTRDRTFDKDLFVLLFLVFFHTIRRLGLLIPCRAIPLQVLRKVRLLPFISCEDL
jgi:hypothetical protein